MTHHQHIEVQCCHKRILPMCDYLASPVSLQVSIIAGAVGINTGPSEIPIPPVRDSH